jgi:hypothetical protein
LCLLHDIRKETTERLIYVTKNLLCFVPYRKYEYTREYRKNERRKDGKGIRDTEREREGGREEETNDDIMKKCEGGESNTRREDIYVMKAGVGVNLDPSPIVASCA